METEERMLIERFGGRFIVGFDSWDEGDRRRKSGAYIATTIRPDRETKRRYTVYPFSTDGQTLCAVMLPRKSLNLLRDHPGVFRVHVEGDDCTLLLLDADKIDTVASALRLRRRRRLSAEHREKLIKAGLKASAPYRFKPGERTARATKQRDSERTGAAAGKTPTA